MCNLLLLILLFAFRTPHALVWAPGTAHFDSVTTREWHGVRCPPVSAACNANYFWRSAPLGLIVSRGKIVSHAVPGKPKRTAFIVQNVKGKQQVGILEVGEWKRAIHSRYGKVRYVETLVQAGPRLLLSGKPCVRLEQEGFRQDVGRRTKHIGLGVRSDGTVVLAWQNDVSLEGFAHTFQRLGCRDAMNLDGGHSATVRVKGKTRFGSGHAVAGLAITGKPVEIGH